jgi:8-oxo-dGTP pyrophosphatase MutT (NUDIX family)
LSDVSLVSQRWLEVREQHVRLANGHEIDRFHLLQGPSWAAVLCLTDDQHVVLVRQYRHGLGGPSLELPAGVIEPREAPIDAARRELREESGFVATSLEPLIEMTPEPARNTTRAHFFFARAAGTGGELALDSSEELEVLLVPVNEVFELIDQGQLVHAAHIAAILLAARRGLI